MTDWQPDAAYCISLMRRADRRVALGNLDARFGFQVKYFLATDGAALAPGAVPSSWRGSAGAYASMLSHRRALQSVPDGGSVLIFEDDAVLPQDMKTVLTDLMDALPPIWESVWLGGEHRSMPTFVRSNVVRCVAPVRTLAYILRGDAVSVAIDAATRAINHFDLPLGRALAARGTCYAPVPFAITSSDDSGDIPDSVPYGVDSI